MVAMNTTQAMEMVGTGTMMVAIKHVTLIQIDSHQSITKFALIVYAYGGTIKAVGSGKDHLKIKQQISKIIIFFLVQIMASDVK